MRFKTWLKECGKSRAEIAAAAETTEASISRIAEGEQTASPSLAKRLVKVADGALTLDDIYETVA